MKFRGTETQKAEIFRTQKKFHKNTQKSSQKLFLK